MTKQLRKRTWDDTDKIEILDKIKNSKEDQNLIKETQIATTASCIESITDEETLREIQTILHNQFDVLRSQKTARVKAKLKVGDRIQTTEGKKNDKGIIGTIVKMNRTRAVVHKDGDSEWHNWNVPFSLISKIGDV
jgi:DNA phosphorothioation-dependent restriction protein DptG|tara:strand:+ start:83 stop:490 length:408 start_codon:yes stop_codon:yes gene_type:complete